MSFTLTYIKNHREKRSQQSLREKFCLSRVTFLQKKLITITILTCVIQIVSAQDIQKGGPVVSIHEVWKLVALNNKKINIAELRVLENNEALKYAEASRLPDISLEGEYAKLTNLPQFENGIFHSPSFYPIAHTYYSLGTSVYFNLYHGGHLNRQIDAQKINISISERQKALTVAEAKLLAAAYYLDLLRGLAFQELLEQDIAEQNKVLRQIKAIYKNGVILKSDVLRAELKLSKQKLQSDQIRRDNTISRQKLNLLAGQADETTIEPVQPFLPDTAHLPSYESLVATASDAPELDISTKEQRLSELRLRDVKANTLPVIGLYANYAYSYPQGQFYPYVLSLYGLGMAGIKGSFPLSALFKNKHQVNIAALEVRQAGMEHRDMEDHIKNQLKEAYLRFQDNLEQINVASTNISQATENLRIVKNSYLNQTSLITDYLDADVQLLQSKFDLTAARIAAQLQFYHIQKITGTL